VNVVEALHLIQVEVGEDDEHSECDGHLNHFQLVARELTVANPVGGHLEAILAECNQPAHDDRGEQRGRTRASGARTTRTS
jgi:hypothetical protein